jgi:hypothetical protein
MLLEKINPRFRLGESNENFCDCIGLVIYYLKDLGYQCLWEADVAREPTSYQNFYNQLDLHGFVKVSSKSPCPLAATWKNPDGTGHIGVYYEGKIYHLRPEGIQIKLHEKEQLWYYIGD